MRLIDFCVGYRYTFLGVNLALLLLWNGKYTQLNTVHDIFSWTVFFMLMIMSTLDHTELFVSSHGWLAVFNSALSSKLKPRRTFYFFFAALFASDRFKGWVLGSCIHEWCHSCTSHVFDNRVGVWVGSLSGLQGCDQTICCKLRLVLLCTVTAETWAGGCCDSKLNHHNSSTWVSASSRNLRFYDSLTWNRNLFSYLKYQSERLLFDQFNCSLPGTFSEDGF